MKKFFLILMSAILAFSSCKTTVETSGVKSPESLGVSSQSILDFIEAAEKTRKDDIHSFILLRHGEVAAQGWWNPYAPELPHMLFSLSKSYTSIAIGIAQQEGLLNVNDKVISFFPDETPENPSKNLQAMRIRDLLRMNTGHTDDATGRMVQDTTSWVKGFLSLDVEHKPGTHFVYNSAATFMLSAIIQKVSGETLLGYLTPRLFEPLNIENPTWETAPGGINTGGWGLNVRTQDIAAFGQLCLQKGMWEGKQLVPAEYIEEASSFQTSNGSDPDSDWEQGYGYQFWRCRHNLYRGDGAFGQYCIVFPEQDAVLAITSGTTDMGAIMNLVWEHLLPGIKDEPLDENTEVYTALQNKLSNLSLSVVEGQDTSPVAESISGQPYSMRSNNEGIKEIVINLQPDAQTISFSIGEKPVTVPFGFGALKKGTITLPPGAEQAVSSSATWTSPETLEVRSYLIETPFFYTHTLSFEGDNVILKRKVNVSMRGTSDMEIRGKKK